MGKCAEDAANEPTMPVGVVHCALCTVLCALCKAGVETVVGGGRWLVVGGWWLRARGIAPRDCSGIAARYTTPPRSSTG